MDSSVASLSGPDLADSYVLLEKEARISLPEQMQTGIVVQTRNYDRGNSASVNSIYGVAVQLTEPGRIQFSDVSF